MCPGPVVKAERGAHCSGRMVKLMGLKEITIPAALIPQRVLWGSLTQAESVEGCTLQVWPAISVRGGEG